MRSGGWPWTRCISASAAFGRHQGQGGGGGAHLASGGQWLGIGWAPWSGGGGDTSPHSNTSLVGASLSSAMEDFNLVAIIGEFQADEVYERHLWIPPAPLCPNMSLSKHGGPAFLHFCPLNQNPGRQGGQGGGKESL